ncbi:hypothetical protein IT41_09935 [Paracoccus halophilus]|uniref:Uncharacterized protein n=1 Tax=Paracoccus halophilus TaxID=376733 RepID=A0A099F1V2_9RHOB|nr:hypothetical protein IT41_09935 [Paracoccus halophilus]
MGTLEPGEIHLPRQSWLIGHAIGLDHDPRFAPQPPRQRAAAPAHHAVQIGLLPAPHAAETRRHQACHLIRHRPDILDHHVPPFFSRLAPLAPLRQWR